MLALESDSESTLYDFHFLSRLIKRLAQVSEAAERLWIALEWPLDRESSAVERHFCKRLDTNLESC